MRNLARQLSIGVAAIAAVAAAGCQSAPPADSSGTATTAGADQATTETADTTPDPATDQPADQPAESDTTEWAMPNLVGTNLQDAQDQIQSLTDGAVFYSASHDLSGKDRSQVLDSNWQVCSQNIAPGSPITSASEIALGAVKISETCP